jgi:hypothetical protein
MKPILQTKFGEQGNCLQACIASLLEIEMDAVPEFPISGQFLHLERFMRQRGLQPVAYPPERFTPPYDVYYLVWGLSPRGIRHSVIYQNNLMVHDPHPDCSGLTTIEQFTVFVATFVKGKT